MKPRILINMHYMEIGGAERALLGLLNAIDTDKVDVDLFINQHTGEFMKLIPEKINLLPEISAYSVIEKPISTAIKKGHFDIALARILAKLHHRLSPLNKSLKDASIFHYVAKYTTPWLPSLKKYGNYNLAISFLAPHNIVKDKVSAVKKIAWIHTDYSIIDINAKEELSVWDSYDNIISISTDVTKSFTTKFPTLREKIIEIENILSPAFIHQQSKLFIPAEMQGDYMKFCSIGRFCHAKNFENIPYIAQLLKEKGLYFRWYIVGFGDTSETIENIKKTNTADCVILLGKKENPYPYITNCNIYIQPSRYEGKSVTVREAQILSKPVVITNYPTAKSQVKDGFDGIICELDNNSIADAVYNLATGKNKQTGISEYLLSHDYGNMSEIEKIYNLIDV